MKQYDEKKICFIICTNDEQQLQECLVYLSLLQVPEGYETELLTITGAKSIAAGYNEGMNASKAKYKVYLHQDTFIVEPFFIEKILKVFKKNKNIGMIGMVGAEKLAKDGVMWNEKRCGNFYRIKGVVEGGYKEFEIIKRGSRQVEVIDGFLMATQYDIPWREDILHGWDFYDVSQSLEFRRAGYQVVVPGQKTAWCNHVCGIPSFWNYEQSRNIIMKEYPEIAEGHSNQLRICCIHSKEITLCGLPFSFQELGHKVDTCRHSVTLERYLDSDVEIVEEVLELGHYDLVFTYDFCRSVAEACHRMNVKYYSWVYDCPLMPLYYKEATYETNYISVFDKKQYTMMQNLKLKHLFQLPLSSEVELFGVISVKNRDIKKYSCDVSFVGRLYDNRGYEQIFDGCDLEIKREADEIVESCQCRWDKNTGIYGKASDQLIDYMVSKIPKETWEGCSIEKRYFCESMHFVRKCNEIERVKILNKLAEHHELVLYSDESPKKMLNNVEIRPWADYLAVMPKVFYLSRINLNITSRSIESGIPQRVWDILSVGGFCLTNYQPELEEHFVIGRDLEVYHDLDELVQKIDYYLEHEDERLRISINGYQAVRNKHDSKERLKVALNYIFDDLEESDGAN